jgi:predicted nucleic acid-binding protein
MRQQHSSVSKSNSASAKEIAPESFKMIMADSVEVMEYYYRGKIQELEQSLSRLNILEHAREIASLCKDIVRIKEVLQKVIIKKGTRFSL